MAENKTVDKEKYLDEIEDSIRTIFQSAKTQQKLSDLNTRGVCNGTGRT